MITIDTPTWRRVVAVPGLCALLLLRSESGGAAAVVTAAASFGIKITDRGS